MLLLTTIVTLIVILIVIIASDFTFFILLLLILLMIIINITINSNNMNEKIPICIPLANNINIIENNTYFENYFYNYYNNFIYYYNDCVIGERINYN